MRGAPSLARPRPDRQRRHALRGGLPGSGRAAIAGWSRRRCSSRSSTATIRRVPRSRRPRQLAAAHVHGGQRSGQGGLPLDPRPVHRATDFVELGGFHPRLLPHYLSDYAFTIRALRRGFALASDPAVQALVRPRRRRDPVAPDRRPCGLPAIDPDASIVDNPVYWSTFVLLTSASEGLAGNLYHRLATVRRRASGRATGRRASMRVHFDDQIVMHQPRGGVSRYFVELVHAVPGAIPVWGSRSTSTGGRRATSTPSPPASGRPADRRRRRSDASPAADLPSRHADGRTSSTRPGTTPTGLPRGHGPPMVVDRRRHDPGAAARVSSRAVNPHLAKEAYARQATAILCISESTRRDCCEVYGPLDASDRGRPPRGRRGLPARADPEKAIPARLPAVRRKSRGRTRTSRSPSRRSPASAPSTRDSTWSPSVAAGSGRMRRPTLRRRGLEGSVHRLEATDAELPGLFGGCARVHIPVAVRGIWSADPRGDGLWHAGRACRFLVAS